MTPATRLSLSLAGFVLVAGGAALRLRYGDAVYFDSLASTLIGCFL